MRKFIKALLITPAAVLLGLGIATVARAGSAVPEINPTDGVSALALIGGAILVIRAYRKK